MSPQNIDICFDLPNWKLVHLKQIFKVMRF